MKRLNRLRPRSDRRWMLLGVTGLSTVLITLALMVALSYRPFESTDENEHVGYALDVSHGFLPTFSTLVRPQIHGMSAGWTYTANHPPLFYTFEAIPLRAGITLGNPLAGFFMGRILNIAFAVAGLVAVVWLARIVLPHRRSAALVTGALVAALPLTIAVSGQIYNDAAAVAASTAAVACCCRLLLLGPSRGRLLAAAAIALLAAAIRATGLEVVLLTILCAGASVALHPPRHSRSRTVLSSALGAGTFTAAATLAGIGWFYVRNDRLYGDLTGANIVVKRFPSVRIAFSSSLTSLKFWVEQYRGLFGRLSLLNGWRQALLLVMFFGLLAALGAAAARLFRAARARSISRPQAAVILLLGAHVAACVAILVEYVSIGGAPFPRYLLAAIPVLAMAVAFGLATLSSRAQVLIMTFVVTSLVTLSITTMTREIAYRNPSWRAFGWSAVVSGMRHNGVPLPAVSAATLLLLLIAGVAVLITCHARLVARERSHAIAG